MCNYLRRQHTEIPKSGYGYKLFYGANCQLFLPSIGSRKYYRNDFAGWVSWDIHKFRIYCEKLTGFCFFLNREDAEYIKFELINHEYSGLIQIQKIEYEFGLGEHIEDNMISGINIKTALCKQFRIIE